MMESRDPLLSQLSNRLWTRDLFKCIDVHQIISSELHLGRETTLEGKERVRKKIKRVAMSVVEVLEEWVADSGESIPRLLVDRADRHPYKRLQESKGPLNQISIRFGEEILDMAEVSSVVAGLEPFHLLRVYYNDVDDIAACDFVMKTIAEKIRSDSDDID